MTHRDNDIDIGGDSILIAATAGSTRAELPLLDVLIPFQQYTVSRTTASTVRIASGTKDLTERFPVGTKIQTSTAGVATDDLEVQSVAFSAVGTTVTMTTPGVTAAIDGIALRKRPKRVLVTLADVVGVESTYIKFGQSTVSVSAANGTGMTRFTPQIFTVSGQTHIAVIQVLIPSAVGTEISLVSVTPLNE